MAGGGTGQFAAVPLNLLPSTGKAVYLNTGTWSAKAAKEASKYGRVIEIKPDFKSSSNEIQWDRDEDVSYFYYCSNETVHGIELNFIPDTHGIPLVADMSSNILTKNFDITKVCYQFLLLRFPVFN
jgi:phosphoserine aminotransferase